MQATSERLASDLLALWHHLMRGSVQQVYGFFEEHDIGLTQIKLLYGLQTDDSACLKDIGKQLGLSLPGASRSVEQLVRRGWLERSEDPEDRRMKRIHITDEGRDVLRRLERARLAGLERFAASIPEAEREALSAALEPIIARIDPEGTPS
jgi:DNA-binding MarR family transcriptional regulator